MDTLFQWNCQEINAKWEELQHVIALWNPVCVCLQEIMARENRSISLRGVQNRAHYGNFDNGPHGGVAMMACRDIPIQAIHL